MQKSRETYHPPRGLASGNFAFSASNFPIDAPPRLPYSPPLCCNRQIFWRFP